MSDLGVNTQGPEEKQPNHAPTGQVSDVVIDSGKRSDAERDALEIAEDARSALEENPSFVASLFMGKCHWDLISPCPEPTDAELREGDELIDKVRVYLKENLDPEAVDVNGEVPKEVLKGLADLGCFGLKIPKKYGGKGFSQFNYNRVMEVVSSHCASTGTWLSAHQSIGVPQPLLLFGTDAQKEKYLPQFAKGAISAFALTEPEAGSDPAKMTTTATPTEDGSAYLINGEKLWCTNGPSADIIVVMATTPPKLVNGREKKQISAFIVETTTPGFEVAHRCQFMGIRGISNGLLRFNNVRVPKENLLWDEGKGLRLALVTLNTGRLTLPSAVLGGCRVAVKAMREWGGSRVQWGQPIGQHETGAIKIANAAATTFALESIAHLACMFASDKHYDIRLEAAMCKLYATEKGWEIMDDLVQLRGGRGYETETSLKARGEKSYPAERMLRDIRIHRILEGSTEIMQLFISREVLQPHLKIVMGAMNSKLPLGIRFKSALSAAGTYIRWYPSQWFYWPFHALRKTFPAPLRKHVLSIEMLSKKLSRTVFHQMVRFGPKLEKKQLNLMRLVWIGTELFCMAAACVRAQSLAKGQFDHESVRLADTYCRMGRQRVKTLFRDIWCNTDKHINKLAGEVLDGKHTTLEKGIVG
jgi:alkylation response protein AidB-like acyl-CoA dehydrogenase